MVFSSLTFIALFLPAFLVLYYMVGGPYRRYVILLGSYSFYAWWRVDFAALLFITTCVNYAISQHITSTSAHKKNWLALGVFINLGILGFFKYANFTIDTFNHFLAAPLASPDILLPIGISFYIFQSISYLIDRYRNDVEEIQSFTDFCVYIALFPQLIAGPIVRYKDIAVQLGSRVHNISCFNEGALYFMAGFCKKVLIADTLAPLVDTTFALENPSFIDAWLGTVSYTMQLYFDFCGYSQMAIGLGLMMGFRFIENFHHPYIATSIADFWRRWHISLSTWLKDYLYIPLGGNRRGALRTYANLMATMLLGGLWHGANMTFLLWGIWHGALLCLERILKSKHLSLPHFMAIPTTLFCVMLGWVMFRAESVSQAMNIYSGLFMFNGVAISNAIAWQVTPLHLCTLMAAIVLVYAAVWKVKFLSVFDAGWARNMCGWKQAILSFLFLIAICKLVAQSYSPFLYFQF